ncbi:MAG: TetR/AcrR family transcriptional regulator [Deltaproteobacteria bacterium]|nr:TetR/AcrR family transcriptional regulator [Deltaproteobacteria bacterium]
MDKSPKKRQRRNASHVPRRAQLLDIAADILVERGYRDTTMLEVAQRASASKETLYAWFGDKLGLFEAVVRRNAARTRMTVTGYPDREVPVESVLTDFGRVLAAVLLDEQAVAIDRAAVAEARSAPSLAESVAKLGRDSTLRTFAGYLERCEARGVLRIDDVHDAAETFLALLLGDAHTRRLFGVIEKPSGADIEDKAERAVRKFLRLYGRQREPLT